MITTTESERIDIVRVLRDRKGEIDRALERYVPKEFTEELLESICGRARYAYDVETATKAISEPIWDMLDRGGKRWRPVLLLLIAEAFGKEPESVLDLAAICELVHNGTLVIDDIEDQSELRRGKPCLHLVYGLDVSVNAGNAMYYLPLLALKKLRDIVPYSLLLRAYEVYAQEMINLHFGQGFDIWWHSGNKEPTVEEYLQMCAYKTGTLARMSAKLSAVVSGGSDDQIQVIGQFAESIGVGFQIQDDILNLVGEEFAKGKGGGEDIHEGKRTLMVIHSLQNGLPEDAARLKTILELHPQEESLIREAIALVEKTRSIDYAGQRAREIVRNAWVEVEAAIPESPAKAKLKAFADFLIEREV